MKNFVKGDYRKHGPIKSVPTTCNFLGKKQGFPDPESGPNRAERRKAKHYQNLRKNTRGFPIGFGAQTWASRCVLLADAQRADDVSRGKDYVSPGKKRQYARPQDFLKGVSGAKILRKMAREQGVREMLMLMHGYNRGVKRHPGYPTRGNYDRTGGRLASPRR